MPEQHILRWHGNMQVLPETKLQNMQYWGLLGLPEVLLTEGRKVNPQRILKIKKLNDSIIGKILLVLYFLDDNISL